MTNYSDNDSSEISRETCGGCENCDGEDLCHIVRNLVVSYEFRAAHTVTTGRNQTMAVAMGVWQNGLAIPMGYRASAYGFDERSALENLADELRGLGMRGVLRRAA